MKRGSLLILRNRRRTQRQLVVSTAVAGALAGACLSVPGAATAAVPTQSKLEPSVEAASPAERFAQEPMPLIELVAPGGVGRLYTTNIDEARRAADNGMTRDDSIGYLPRTEVDGSHALYRLKPEADATRWLLTASEDERDRLLADGWVEDGVVGFAWTEPTPGMVELQRFSNGEEWRVAREDEHDDLVDAGYTFDGGIGFVYETWIRAGAVMFPMWHPGGHTKEAGCEQEYGRRDVWCGVRDFNDGHANGSGNWPDADFSWLQPTIGYYDDSNPRKWEQHIDHATSAGLSFFSAYWYWDSANAQEYSSDVGLEAFLAAPNSSEIDFTVAVCAHEHEPRNIPADQFDAAAEALVTKYLSQENVLRANDGRKVLSLCDTRGLGDGSNGDVADFIAAVREQARAELDEELYVSISYPAHSAGEIPTVDGDGAYCTTDSAAVEGQSYEAYLAGQRDFFAVVPEDRELIRCAMSGFDERTRYPVQKPDIDEIRYFRDYDTSQFETAVSNLRADMVESERPPNVDNLAVIFAWNEWDEGAAIEPNVRDECYFLDVIRAGLALRNGEGCAVIWNNAPEPTDLSVEVEQDTPTEIELTGTDADGDQVSIALADEPGHGDLEGDAPLVTYTPELGFVGDDEFTFTVHDGTATSEPGTVRITVVDTPEPTESPEPTETPTPTDSPTPTETPEPTSSPTEGGDGDLPDTGVPLGALLVSLFLLVASGLVAVRAQRRRDFRVG